MGIYCYAPTTPHTSPSPPHDFYDNPSRFRASHSVRTETQALFDDRFLAYPSKHHSRSRCEARRPLRFCHAPGLSPRLTTAIYRQNSPPEVIATLYACSEPPLNACASPSTVLIAPALVARCCSRLPATRRPRKEHLKLRPCLQSSSDRNIISEQRIEVCATPCDSLHAFPRRSHPDRTCHHPAAAQSRSQSTKRLLEPEPYRTYRPA